MAKLSNLARMTVSSAPGTGSTIGLGAAASGHISFANSGIVNGDVVTYMIVDGSNREIGTATYSSTGPSLTGRTVLNSTNSNAAINATATAEVGITAAASDFVRDATGLPFSATGSISATNVQAAIAELDTEKAPLSHTHVIAEISGLGSALNGKAYSIHDHVIADITGLQTALDLKAPLASPTFTGTPAAPTPTAGTNTTQIATTAFVTTAANAKLGLSGGTLSGKLILAEPYSAIASINFPKGTAPSSPAEGDIWFTTSGTLSVRQASATKTVAYTDGNITGTSANVTGTVAIANGGTGATSASAARTALGIGSMATRSVTISASAPSGGSDGDIWYQI